ncbi:hypothetical protein DPMN_010007 [Dreissena polymorpha]|uniref:Uncharacterized protein n=1 Tax=Dreissena polymorpha TaxID=45954 RepID=A0A9D4RYR1_DREPO|nr:hypothetical protein DPMN_010007 [Dreissena polymorpha]
MLGARIMKLHRYIDHDLQMTPIDFEVTRSKQLSLIYLDTAKISNKINSKFRGGYQALPAYVKVSRQKQECIQRKLTGRYHSYGFQERSYQEPKHFLKRGSSKMNQKLYNRRVLSLLCLPVD